MSATSTKDAKKPIPKWLLVSYIASTAAAIAVPFVVWRRQRANLLKALTPPPRRTTQSVPITLPPRATLHIESPTDVSSQQYPEDDFNGALYSAKAFGIATLIVALSASASVWGVQTYVGVNNTQEFGTRMRAALLQKMPVLSSRMYGSRAEVDEPGHATVEKWEWEAAETRLTEAFEKNGFLAWAEVAQGELEAEMKLERMKRKNTLSDMKDERNS